MSLLIKLPDGKKSPEISGAVSNLLRVNGGGQADQYSDGNESLLPVIACQLGTTPRKGRVQSAIAALFRAQPDRVFTAVDLAQAIHGEATRTTCKTIRRAADGVAKELGWTRRKMWGRVDYVRPETISRITRLRAEKAVEQTRLGYC